MAKQTNAKTNKITKNQVKKQDSKKEIEKKQNSSVKKQTKKTEIKKETKSPIQKIENPKAEKTQTKTKKMPADEATKLVEVILILLVIFAAFYIITYWVKKSGNKKTLEQETQENAVIQYDEILIGRLFMQKNNEYYVLIVDKEDTNNYQSYLTSYKEKENALRFYTADLGDAMNQKYKAEASNLATDDITNLKVKDTTLVKIKDQKIEETLEGKTEVITKLGELIK